MSKPTPKPPTPAKQFKPAPTIILFEDLPDYCKAMGYTVIDGAWPRDSRLPVFTIAPLASRPALDSVLDNTQKAIGPQEKNHERKRQL